MNITANWSCVNLARPDILVTVPVFGLTTGSVTMCTVVIIMSATTKRDNFFKLKLIDRVSVYTASFELLFYLPQTLLIAVEWIFADMMKIRIVVFVATFIFMEFAYAQIFTSLIIAATVLVLMTKNRTLYYGKYDWRMLVPVLGIPLLVLIILNFRAGLQPECEESAVMSVFEVYFFVITMSFVVLIVLYSIILVHVIRTTNQIQSALESQSQVNVRRLAVKLSLYIIQYFIKFGGNVVEGMWKLVADPPSEVRISSLIFVVSGGILNGIVYFIIRRMS